MKTNTSLTIYHKYLDKTNHLDKWKRQVINYVMWQGGKGAGINTGYVDANDIQIFIPYSKNDLSNIEIAIGDIVVNGSLETEISMQSELKQDNYNIVTIIDNNYGSLDVQHIRIGAK